MRPGLIITAVIFIIVIVMVTVALSTTVSDRTLTSGELNKINQACIGCHKDDLTGDSVHGLNVEADCFSCHDRSHSVHASSDCWNCHTETAGLKTADRAYDTLRWVGIGGAGLLLLILALNLFISRRRMGKREE